MNEHPSTTALKLHFPRNETFSNSLFFRSLMGGLPDYLKQSMEQGVSSKDDTTDSGDEQPSHYEIVLNDTTAVLHALFAVKESVRRQSRMMTKSYRNCLIGGGVDKNRINYLRQRVDELCETAPESDECINLQNDLVALEQYQLRFEELKKLVKAFDDYLVDLRDMELSPLIREDPAEIVKDLQVLLEVLFPSSVTGEELTCLLGA